MCGADVVHAGWQPMMIGTQPSSLGGRGMLTMGTTCNGEVGHVAGGSADSKMAPERIARD